MQLILMLQIGGEEPGDAVAQSSGHAAAVDFLEGYLVGGGNFVSNELFQSLGKLGIVTFKVELKVEAQAARIPIGGAEQDPAAINDHQFRMVEGRRGEPNAAAMFEQLPPHGPGCPLHKSEVVYGGQNYVDFDAAHCCEV